MTRAAAGGEPPGFGVRQLARLHEAGIATARGGSDRGVFDLLLDVLLEVLAADFGMVHVIDGTGHGLQLAAWRGDPQLAGVRDEAVVRARVCQAAFESRRHLMEMDIAASRRLEAATREALLRTGAVALDAAPLESSSGSIIGVVSTYWLTPRRLSGWRLRLAAVLRRQAADFAGLASARRAWRARQADVRNSCERAEAASRTQEQFLATLAHELRQPLAAVLPAFAMYQRSASEERRQHAADVIQQQLGQMRRLLDDLGDATLASRGVVPLKREPVALDALLAQVIESMHPVFDQRRHTVTLDLAAGPACVLADPVRVRQVFSNLLQNAAAYTPPGGRIDVAIGSDDSSVRVTVRDSGVGIPPDALERVFEIFERGSEQNAASSFGVGLAVVRQIVERHGGRVLVSSEPGRGSEFLVTLPAAGREP